MKTGGNFKNKTDRIVKCNHLIRDIAEEKGCIYVDLYNLYAKDDIMPEELTRDGVHLLPEAYDRWAEAIRVYVEK